MGLQIDEEKACTIERIGVVGTGIMGSMLTLLFAEHAAVEVSIFDLSEANMCAAVEKADKAGLGHKVKAYTSISTLCQSLSSPRVLLFSLPHGKPGDAVVQSLTPHLSNGDIVIDGSNEDYRVTQKRQGWLQTRGVSYVGMGVSGGFAGARHGPSLMPSGDDRALDLLMPILRKVAAKDDQGRACVARIGPGGSGHYVKMVHNGIEHGIMSVLCEAWAVMNHCLGMTGEEIGAVFDSWNEEGGLVSCVNVIIIRLTCCRETTFWYRSADLYAEHATQAASNICFTKSEILLCKTQMTQREQECGQIWKPLQDMFLRQP